MLKICILRLIITKNTQFFLIFYITLLCKLCNEKFFTLIISKVQIGNSFKQYIPMQNFFGNNHHRLINCFNKDVMANKTLTSYKKLFFKSTFEEQLKTPLFISLSLSLSLFLCLSITYLLTKNAKSKNLII